MGAEHSFLYRDLYGNLRSRAITAKTATLQNIPGKPEDSALNSEADVCATYAQWLCQKMNSEIINDIRSNAPTVSEHQWKKQGRFRGAH